MMVVGFAKRFFSGICDQKHGERYSAIARYFVPEFVTALILSSLLNGIDAMFVANLRSTSLYAAQGLSSTMMHFISKALEGLSVGPVILCGYFNGRGEHENVGKALATAFWISLIIGACVAFILFVAAPTIYAWYGVSHKITTAGVGYLRIRAFGIFFQCIFYSLVGFLRGIKNTRIPMMFFMGGGVIFVLFDYLLVFGKYGFPQLNLFGSAYAAVIQYGCMVVGALSYIMINPRFAQYKIRLFTRVKRTFSLRLLLLSFPVAVDKAILAFAKVWLLFLVAPLGKVAITSFTVIKDMEQFAFVPAIACAQVITFLVSNDYGVGNWRGIKNNIKKILFLATVTVFTILLIFSCAPHYFMHFFDKKEVFASFAAQAFPIISLFVIFDVLQLILAAVLRGTSKVNVVMIVRLLVCALFVLPGGWLVAHLPLTNLLWRFIIIYVTFYLADAIMGFVYGVYILRFSNKEDELDRAAHARLKTGS